MPGPYVPDTPVNRYQLAHIDWVKYGGCFRNLSRAPDNTKGCVYTMCEEFTDKDFLRGLPPEAPWSVVQRIKSFRPLVDADARKISPFSPSAQAELLGLCLDFNTWASAYFESEEAPWERHRVEDMRTTKAKLKPWFIFVVCVIVLLIYLANR